MISLRSTRLRKISVAAACVSALLLSACGGSDDAPAVASTPPVVLLSGYGLNYADPQDISISVQKLGITPLKIECSKSILPAGQLTSDGSGGLLYLHIPFDQAAKVPSDGRIVVRDPMQPGEDNIPIPVGGVFKKIPIRSLAPGEQIPANAEPCRNF